MGRSVRPRPRQEAIGCEKTVIRQTPRVQRPPVQAYCGDDTASHVGAAFGRRPSISRRISANNRRGIAISASWNVTYRPCRTTLREKLVKISAKVVRHGHYITFQMADVAIPRPLFAEILRLIDGLRPAPLPP